MQLKTAISAFIIGASAIAQVQAAPVTFLVTDGAKLFRADSTGATFGFVTMSAQVQSLTIVPTGVNLPGASAGDIVACARTATSGRYALYRLDDPFGAASLTQIGSLSTGIGSLTFANGEMYGIEDSLNPLRVYKFDMNTGNSVANWNTGVASPGGGGFVYSTADSQFYLTDATNHRLYSWGVGGTASLVGPVGFGFSNNGMEYHEGVLYGGLRRDSPSNAISCGYFNTTTGAFTVQATVTGVAGNGTGFVAVPEPGSMLALLVGSGLLKLRRRR